MSGSYDKAKKWADDYDDNSGDLLSTCASLSNALANFSNILNTAGHNWATANWQADSSPNKGSAPSTFFVPQGKSFETDIQTPPASYGGSAQGLDTSIPGLISQIGYQVPNGDRDKLKSAADAWNSFAQSAAVKDAEAQIKKITAAFDAAGTSAPDIQDVKNAGTARGVAAVAAGAERIRKLWTTCRLFQTLEAGVGIALGVNAVHPLKVQTALDDLAALTAVSVAGAFVAEMAKGGKQRVADTGIEQEMRDLMSREGLDKCGALAKLWDTADKAKRLRVKKTQKFYDCRESSGGGGR
ncbi:polymorphic toxin type 34 domain-containing protein [Nocardia thailandica]